MLLLTATRKRLILDPGTDPGTMTVLRHVASHTAWWRISASANEARGTTIVSEHTVTSAAKDLRIRRGVHTHAGAESITGRAGLVVRGVLHPITWAGAETVTIPKGSHADSDPVQITVEAGETIQTTWEAPGGGKYPSGVHMWDEEVARITSGGFAGVSPLNSKALSVGPHAILGLTTSDARSIVCLGDSILESGWMRRAAHATGAAWADLSQWAEGIPQSSLLGRLAPDDGPIFTLGLTEYGTNNRAMSVADTKAAMVSHWSWLTAGPVERLGQTTMTPYVAGGGDYSTLAGQTAIDQVWRNELNAWLRDGAPLTAGNPAEVGTAAAVRAGEAGHPLVGICDVAASVEQPNGTGLVWRVDRGALAVDGLHPTRAGADVLQEAAAPWIAAHI